MKILFYCGHPSQYLFIRETMRRLSNLGGHRIILLIKSKDVLENLVIADGFSYINIQTKERGFSKFEIGYSFIKRVLKIFYITIKENPRILVGTDATLAIVGWLLCKKVITVLEDDYLVIKRLADLCFPFTSSIVCPSVCDVGPWVHKKIGYSGYMKLGYLHPNVFSPYKNKLAYLNLPENFVIIRVAKLAAHHDFGQKGLSSEILSHLINLIREKGYSVFISSEVKLNSELSAYKLNSKPEDIHNILANASLLISDSQSMSVEAAVLGVPSIRFSSFTGKISVLEELEHKYNLTIGIHPDKHNELFRTVESLFSTPNLKQEFFQRKTKMLSEKIDPTAFMVWFIENYPDSEKVMRENPNYQYKFAYKV